MSTLSPSVATGPDEGPLLALPSAILPPTKRVITVAPYTAANIAAEANPTALPPSVIQAVEGQKLVLVITLVPVQSEEEQEKEEPSANNGKKPPTFKRPLAK